MLENDTLKNGTSRIGLYGSALQGGGGGEGTKLEERLDILIG